MGARRLRVVGLALLGLSMLVPPPVRVQATLYPDAPGKASALLLTPSPGVLRVAEEAPSPAEDPPERSPLVTLAIWYADEEARPQLMRAVHELERTGQIEAVDTDEGPGRVVVLGAEDAVTALSKIEGVIAVAAPHEAPAEWMEAQEERLSAPPAPGLAPSADETPFPPRPASSNTTPPPWAEQQGSPMDPDSGADLVETQSGSQPLPVMPPGTPAGRHGDPAPTAVAGDGQITGVVTADDGGAPLENVSVCAYQSSPYVHSCSSTDVTGFYTISVPGGRYRVKFTPFDHHVSQYYDDTPLNHYADATLVDVADDAVTSGIDASLAPGAQVLGRVTEESSGDPLPNVTVYVVGGPDGAYSASYYYTGPTGTYTTTPGLPAGTYRVSFTDYTGVYAAEYYANAHSPALAAPLEISTHNRTGIDASLIPGAVIDGVVTGSGPLEGIYVTAYYSDTFLSGSMDTTDPAGQYRIAGLGPVAYKLNLYDPHGQYLQEWHNDKADWSTADPVPLTSGLTTTVNIELTAGGVVRGTITDDESGLPLEGIRVRLYDSGGNYATSATSDAAGAYRIGPLDPGHYKAGFQDDGGNYLPEYYDDKPDRESADQIVVSGGMTTTVDAALAPAGALSGQVTAEGDGTPLANITVMLYDATTGGHRTSVSTDAGGAYRLGGLPGGTYKLGFADGHGVYITEYYDNQRDLVSAHPISVTGGTTTTIDVALTRAAVIRGTVTDEDSGAPLEGISVYGYDAMTHNFVANDTTDGAGAYQLGGLRTGDYKLAFYGADAGYLSEFYDDKPNLGSADPVSATAGTTQTIDVALTPGGTLTGQVTDEGSGDPLEGIRVTLYTAATDSYVTGADTDAAGVYRMTLVAPGAYKVRFYDYAGDYFSEYHENQPDLSSADHVAVTGGMTTTVHAQLTPAAVLRGTVTAEGSGVPLENVRVYAYDAATHSHLSSNTTDDAGTYRIGGLAAGSCKVRFLDQNHLYLTEYHEDKPALDSADPVPLTAGMTTTVDAALTPGATITGRVTAEEDSAPLEDIRVRIYDATTHSYVSNTLTDAAGVYRIGRLVAGSYKAEFSDSGGTYLTEYHDDRLELSNADPITVTLGATVTVDAALTEGGRITGRVTDAVSGEGLAGVSVRAERKDGDTAAGTATTGADGTYTTTAVHTGVYQVRFDPPQPYGRLYYENHRQSNAFTPVSVRASYTTPGIDAALRAGPTISGTVTGAGGLPLSGVRVAAYRGGSPWTATTDYTDSEGRYQLGPLDPDRYRVYFKPADHHVSEWYDDAQAHPQATVIQLTGGATDVDAQLALGARITGTVTSAGSGPLAGVWVEVYPLSGDQVVAAGETDAQGRYVTQPGLAPGSYQVAFSAPPGYISEWYDDTVGQDEAAVIAITGAVDRTEVDAELAAYEGGTITGIVTAADTGQPLSMWVYAYDAEGTNVRSDYASGGVYELDHLRPGAYSIRFSASSPYVAVYYGGQFDRGDAEPVTVTAGATVAHIDQAVPRGGAVTGQVTGSGGLPGVYVYAQRVTGGYDTGSAYTGVDGAYRLEGLKGGGYRVRFSPPAPFISEWYDDALTEDGGQSVSVALNTTTPHIDAALATGGVVTGTITAEDTGVPLPSAYTDIYSGTSPLITSIYADVDGIYRTPGLPPGDYRVRFDAGTWSGYRDEWYEDAPSRDDAHPVTVVGTGTTPSIDGALAHGGAISGWAYDSDTGLPLNSVYVRVHESTSGSYVDYDYTNSFGFYVVEGLTGGSYHVKFSEEGYADQWYDRASDESSALAVTLVAPDETTGIDAHLLPLRYVHLPLIVRGP